ncbi:MAG: ATP-binding cassette domain-containing protein [Synechococcaceae cyanobacterium]|nr:ATP-binding cassette domain-containing protein [Synechococcaceae cyanobacterium]
MRGRIGYLTQRFSLYRDLTVEENIAYVAGVRGVPPAEARPRRAALLERMDLARFGGRLAGDLSGGMRQKLALCCALIDTPALLLLDEPTTGVDPVARREFWDLLAALNGDGVTIVVATPYLDEAERCNRVALLHEGRIRRLGTPAELRAGLGLTRLELRGPQPAEAAAVLERARLDVQSFGDRIDVLVPEPAAGRRQVERILAEHGLAARAVTVDTPTLENVFVSDLRREMPPPPALPFPEGGERRVKAAGEAIVARGLGRRFGAFEAVKDLDLTVAYGEVFGLLGANGAGKTTTIRMLCGLLPPTAGTVALAGEPGDLRGPAQRRRIGYMSQGFTLYDDLTIRQNLEFHAGVYGVPPELRRERIAWVLATCGLEDRGEMTTGLLPGGWKRRVALGAAVLHDPPVLFLDEPTSGVDPLARRQVWQLINAFAQRGAAVLVTTHYLEEAEQCHRLCFLVAGERVIEGAPGAIRAAQGGALVELALPAAQIQGASELLRRRFAPWRVSRFGDRLHLVLEDPGPELAETRALLAAAELAEPEVRPIPFSLEDAFIGTVARTRERRGAA